MPEYHYQAVKTRSDRVMIEIYGNDMTKTKVQCITRLNGFKTTLSLIFRTTSIISLTAISLLRAPSVEKLDHPNPSSRLTFDSIEFRLDSGFQNLELFLDSIWLFMVICVYIKSVHFFSYQKLLDKSKLFWYSWLTVIAANPFRGTIYCKYKFIWLLIYRLDRFLNR